jgi:ABC-2 type transport system permease protein
MNRLRHLLKKEFIQLFRDRRLLPLVFLVPVIQLILFGYVVSTDIKHLSTAVRDLDRSSASRELVKSFSNAGFFDINFYAESPQEITKLMEQGRVAVALTIPSNFSQKLKRGETAPFQLIFDGSDSSTANTALNYASRIVQAEIDKVVEKRLAGLPGSLRIEPIDARLRVWYNAELESVNYMVPGLISVILMVTTMILTSVAIVREKERGTLEQLIVTPIMRWELVLGKTIPFVIVGFVEVILIILVGKLWFQVPLRGDIGLLLAMCAIFILNTLGLGLFISTISRTQQQAMLTSFFFLLPAFLLSGFIFPIENMPRILQYITYAIPLRYFLVIIRTIFLKGVGISAFWDEALIMTAFGLVILVLSILRFQKKFAD